MSHTPRVSTLNEGANSSTKSTTNTLRPHYYTSFQNYCCGPKLKATTTNKDLLPIPDKFKSNADKVITHLNGKLVERSTKIERFTSVILREFINKNDQYKIQKYLIDQTMFRTLKDAQIINWITDFRPLYPIKTSGNGNCLLHAVLISMIGIHDFTLLLRDQLADFMKNNEHALKAHWRIEKLKADQKYGITSEDANFDSEWKELCSNVHYQNSEDGQAETYLEFLEAIHIFSVSNMLQRPIIVLSEDIIRNKVGEAISVNDLFGIYLPIFSPPNECVNYPIILAYNQSHFCPLQPSEISDDKLWKNLIPLYLSVDHMHEKTMLPIRFVGEDVSTEHANGLLRDYLQIETVTLTSSSMRTEILCAKMGGTTLSDRDNFFLIFYDYLMDFFDVQKPKAIEEERQRERQRELDERAARSETSPTRFTRLSYTSPRDLTNVVSFQHILNDDQENQGAYIPSNGAVHIGPGRNDPYYDRIKQYDLNRSENITNTSSNGKFVNSISMPLQSNGSSYSREERQPTGVPIPVHHVSPRSPSSKDPSITIYEPGLDFPDKCLMCNRRFNNVGRSRFCALCEFKTQNDPVQPSTSRQQNPPRTRSTNLYPPAYDTRQYPILSPTSNQRPLAKIICSRCNSPNLPPNRLQRSDYHCSACGYLLS